MAAWHSGTNHQIVECPMCHIFMNPCTLDDHLATRHSRSVSDYIEPSLDPEPTPVPTRKNYIVPTPVPTRKELHCPVCTKVVSTNKKKFAKHMKIHTNIICALCSSSVSMEKFSTHTDICRKSHNAVLTCPLCNEKLAKKKPNKHFKQHVPRLKCPIAPCPYFEYDTFNIHIATHFQKLVSEQELCSIEDSPKSVHSNTSPLTQDIYESGYSLDEFYEENTYSEDINRSIQPPQENPNIQFSDKLDVKSRLYTQISHQCPFCNIKDLNESHFESHLQTCLETHPNPLECPQCVRKFPKPVATVKHLHRTHLSKLHTCQGCHNTIPCFTIKTHPIECLNKSPLQLTKQQKIILNSRKITCPICQRQCNKTQISFHILTHAIFQCQSCGWSTEKLCEFTPHIFSCVYFISNPTRSSTYSCPVCYKTFPKTKFSEHVLTKHSHVCPICNTAMSKNELTFHGLLCTVSHYVPINAPKNTATSPTSKPKKNPVINPSPPTPTPIHKSKPKPKPKPSNTTNSTAIQTSKFSCPFCSCGEIEDLQLIRSHLLSCEKIKENSNLHVVNLPDIVGLRIN